jgi:hypothetical protein
MQSQAYEKANENSSRILNDTDSKEHDSDKEILGSQ